jgi:hypothetical protein
VAELGGEIIQDLVHGTYLKSREMDNGVNTGVFIEYSVEGILVGDV